MEISGKCKRTIVIRLGVFHTICTLLAIVGKRFQDAGLLDHCIELGVSADGSISGVMDGRKYNRAVRLHKILYEAFIKLAWRGFHSWLQDNYSNDVDHMDETMKVISNLCEDVSQASLEQVIQNRLCARIMNLFEVYLDFLRVGNGNLSHFWLSYLDMVEILVGFVRASIGGHWLLHLASIRVMISWCFAYERQNYARHLTYYYAQMTQLPVEHPDHVYAEFMQGHFSVQLGPNNPF